MNNRLPPAYQETSASKGKKERQGKILIGRVGTAKATESEVGCRSNPHMCYLIVSLLLDVAGRGGGSNHKKKMELGSYVEVEFSGR